MEKNDKKKLGRPKLADIKTKKEATIYIAIAFVLLIVFAIGGTYSLYSSFSANKLKGYVFCGPYTEIGCKSAKYNGYPCHWINNGCYGGLPSETKKTTKKTTTKKTAKPKYYTVKFSANGGTGSMNEQYITHGDYNNNTPTKLKLNEFKRTNYSFTGWYAKRSADAKWYGYNSKNKLSWYSKDKIKKYYLYKDGQGVSRTVAPGAYVTMYAQWTYNAPSTAKIILKCPTSVKVNQPFKCETNMDGVKISATSKFLVNYNSSFTTTKKDKAKDLMYKAPITVEVKAKKNNKEVIKSIKVDGQNYKKHTDGFIYYSQKDYSLYPYNSGVKNDNIAMSGCGTTSMAMVLATLLKNENITPVVTTNEACANGYCSSSGTDSLYFRYAADNRKIKSKLFRDSNEITRANLAKVATVLNDGGLAIVAVNSNSPFTNAGHFIVIRKLDKDKHKYNSILPLNSYVYVADPNHPELTNPYKLSDFINKDWITGIYLFNTKDIK